MFRLYSGLVREEKWFNHAEVSPLPGGALALLKGGDKSGAARILNLVKGSIDKLYTESKEEYILKDSDYNELKAVDTWKIGYEQIKLKTGEDYPIIEEHFRCDVCSRPGMERYTEINESWQKLIDDGKIDEYFQLTENPRHIINLPVSFKIEPSKTVIGGEFNKIIVEPISIGDMLAIHHDAKAMASEENQIYAVWDASIVEIPGLSNRDFNIIKRSSNGYFSQKYITDEENIEALLEGLDDLKLGLDGNDRKVTCKNCGSEIGGYLDFTNFFSPLLTKKRDQKG
ncbi:MAG: hypothetical protein ACFFG0_02540 [Candidatus Thorarchaeota archaeon]